MSSSSATIATAIKMLESLPETIQAQVVEQLREFIADLDDERAWDLRFRQTQTELVREGRRVKGLIAQGEAEPLDLGQL